MHRRRVQTPACLVYLRVRVVEGLNSAPRSGRRVHSHNSSRSNNTNQLMDEIRPSTFERGRLFYWLYAAKSVIASLASLGS